MGIPTVEISYLAVLVGSIIALVVGGLWYSPALFGRVWMKLSGMTRERINEAKKKGMAATYFINFIAVFVTGLVMALLAAYIGLTSAVDGLYLGLLTWIGFIVTIMLGTVLWEGKPIKLYLINIFYYLIVLVVMGILVSVWH